MKKIGLALGSGGARGWAHIGVIDALEEADIPVQCVAGASIGALVGGAFASGHIQPLKEMTLRLDWKRALYYFLEVAFPRSGLIDGMKIAAFVRQHVGEATVESLPMPFAAVATNILTGQEVVIDEGDMIEAIRASISIPGILTPVSRDGAILVDGGLVDPVPVQVVRRLGADFVIAVDLNYKAIGNPDCPRARGPERAIADRKKTVSQGVRKLQVLLQKISQRIDESDLSMPAPVRHWLARDDKPNIFDVLGYSIRIMETQITNVRLKLDPPDILIRPPVGHFRFMEFHRADEMIHAGYRAAKERLDEIKALVEDR